MLKIPRSQPRPPRWRLPLAAAVLVLFLAALWATGQAPEAMDGPARSAAAEAR